MAHGEEEAAWHLVGVEVVHILMTPPVVVVAGVEQERQMAHHSF